MKKALVIGDSHCLPWGYIQKHRLIKDFTFLVKHVNGATSQGVINPNSKTNALPKFQKSIRKNLNSDCIIISLGEVDCGFAIWYYADQFGVSVNEQLKRSLDAYETFLKNDVLTNFLPSQIILTSSILPTIDDQTNKEFLAGARSKVTTSIKERTQLTLKYNRELAVMCKKYNLHYIDITNDILDTETQTVKQMYKHKNPNNHHLNRKVASKIYINHFNQLQL